jgi:hypothetical protein
VIEKVIRGAENIHREMPRTGLRRGFARIVLLAYHLHNVTKSLPAFHLEFPHYSVALV